MYIITMPKEVLILSLETWKNDFQFAVQKNKTSPRVKVTHRGIMRNIRKDREGQETRSKRPSKAATRHLVMMRENPSSH
jgi:hypothetical protein